MVKMEKSNGDNSVKIKKKAQLKPKADASAESAPKSENKYEKLVSKKRKLNDTEEKENKKEAKTELRKIFNILSQKYH